MKYAITISMITLDIEMMYLRIVSMAVIFIGVTCREPFLFWGYFWG